MLTESFEWDGETHLGDTRLFDWVSDKDFNRYQKVEAYCDCFHLKGCCSLVVNDEKIRAGDKLIFNNGTITIERGDTPPLICPVHNEEHKGTGTGLCMYTGEHS